MSLLARLFPRHFARRRACAAAEEACRALRPGEPILGSVICAEEQHRLVVRVFCGRREGPPALLPAWRECVIFAVATDGRAVLIVEDDASCRPQLR